MDKEALTIKFASENWEFEEINRLNYKTFVKEIPQHAENEDQALEDQFHDENEYLIVIQEREVLGMVAFRDKRPFSLDQKLPDLDSYLPQAESMCEIRLLAIKKEYRSTRVFWMMLKAWRKHWKKKGYDLVVVSGHSEQIAFYKSLGLISFGPALGEEPVQFQPMYWTAESFRNSKANKVIERMKLPAATKSFLPGPVNIPAAVVQEYSRVPEYHRTSEFIGAYEELKKQLSKLVGARSTQILMGSGTLGNDVVAAQLSLLDSHGLILSNGEFGERLIDHAKRHGLKFEVLREDWGAVFSGTEVEEALSANKNIKWIWAVHCETSTGVLQDLDMLKGLAKKYAIKLCLDCMSSLGLVPLDLSHVYLATSTSGKGLASLAGLSLIFHNHDAVPKPNFPIET